ncbi:NfeD family protein [Candidatus Palauibacter sp.]|uniref:NfeD family protein n=1 Tax=Candidatus Palauibacter sp. TaxID=3101350 RepID=UPI003B02E74B
MMKRQPMSGTLGIPGLALVLVAMWAPGEPPMLRAPVAAASIASPRAQTTAEVVRVPITGTIELGVAPFVARALSEAAAAGAPAVILDLDTPGGRVDAAWKIIDDLRDSEVPVYAYVNRRALSAGAMIALAADRIYMRPGSTMGAATPVTGQGEKASEKMVSAMRSEFRALAEERGLDPRIAEAMVDESVEVPGVSEAGKLLTLTTEEATELGVADGEVRDLLDLLEVVGQPAAAVRELQPNWAEAVVRFLTNPAVAPLLLSLGFLGVLVEVRTPSFGVAGAVGLGALAAFFGAHHLVHLAGLEEILLFGAGVVLIALEVLVIPGFGIAGILGTGAVLAAAVLGMVGQFPTFDQVFNAAGLVALSIILVGVTGWALMRRLPRTSRLQGLFLRDSTSRETGYISSPPREDLVGQVGVTTTDLRPAGVARVGDERIHVVTEGPWLEAGTPVRVLEVGSSRVVVRRAGQTPETPASEDRDN